MNHSITGVQLVGVPHYLQGSADGLCVYYAMSMVLVALHPELHPSIHERPRYKRMGSPILQMLRQHEKGEPQFRERVGKWFFDGMSFTEATGLLNDLLREYYERPAETYFMCRRVKFRRMVKRKYNRRRHALERIWTPSEICNVISWHLPVIVSGGSFGNHAIVAIGWERKGRSRWITYYDPGCEGEQLENSTAIFFDDCEVIIPNQDLFKEHRPPALITRGKCIEYELYEEEKLQVKPRVL